MQPKTTAILLVGFQNDYFAEDGILHSVLEDTSGRSQALRNTIRLLEHCKPTAIRMVSTPIIFTPDYSELVEPVGILKTIRDVRAFRADSPGSATIPELSNFASRIVEIPGKRGLNAFAETELEQFLREQQIRNVVLAGVVTSLCIDSTGRSAHERGYRVTVLSDCTCGRSRFEQQFYCEQIFPMYADVITSWELVQRLQETMS